jgi:hypothetical protein
MAESTGYILAAAAITAANEAVFAPAVSGKPLWTSFNWRIIPATGVAALMLAGLEQLSVPLGKGLAMLALLTVVLVPVGNAPSPVENVSKMLGMK